MTTDTRVASVSRNCFTSIKLLANLPPLSMIEIFLDLAGVGKEFITSHLELDTSTDELTLP